QSASVHTEKDSPKAPEELEKDARADQIPKRIVNAPVGQKESQFPSDAVRNAEKEKKGWMEMKVLGLWKVGTRVHALIVLQKRYFHLVNSKLHYFKKLEDAHQRGTINLKGTSVTEHAQNKELVVL